MKFEQPFDPIGKLYLNDKRNINCLETFVLKWNRPTVKL